MQDIWRTGENWLLGEKEWKRIYIKRSANYRSLLEHWKINKRNFYQGNPIF